MNNKQPFPPRNICILYIVSPMFKTDLTLSEWKQFFVSVAVGSIAIYLFHNARIIARKKVKSTNQTMEKLFYTAIVLFFIFVDPLGFTDYPGIRSFSSLKIGIALIVIIGIWMPNGILMPSATATVTSTNTNSTIRNT